MISEGTIQRMIDGAIERLRARVRGMIVSGVVKVLTDGAGFQRVQVDGRADELIDDAEALSPHGFTSRPSAGAEALVFAVEGNAANRVALVFSRSTRLKTLAEGEAALHIGVEGQVVHLKANGDVVITPGAGGGVYLADGAATKRVALAEEVDDRLGKLQLGLDTHVHATAAVGPPVAPTPVPGVMPVGTLPSTAATDVYAKG